MRHHDHLDASTLVIAIDNARWDLDNGRTRLRWAAYAFDASRRLYDGYHPRTLSAAGR